MSILTKTSTGKGDLRRTMQVSLREFEKRWDHCFGRNTRFKNSKDRGRDKKGLQRQSKACGS